MRKILVTGGAGFLGSHLIPYLLTNRNTLIFNIDNLSLPNSRSNLQYLSRLKNHLFSKTSTVDRKSLRKIIRSFKPDLIIHLAAHTHVDDSITSPYKHVMENALGSLNLLEETRSYFFKDRELHSDFKLLQFSTDEVYGSLYSLRSPFTHSSPINPSNPYSASKAAADVVAQSYYKTYGLPVILCRSTNLYGARQDNQKFIPRAILHLLRHQPIPIYGKGLNKRNWVYVLDCCEAIRLILQKGEPGLTYHIASKETYENRSVASKLICLFNEKHLKISLPKSYEFIKDRPAHDFQYLLDASETTKLGWKPTTPFSIGLDKTISWYIKNAKRTAQ